MTFMTKLSSNIEEVKAREESDRPRFSVGFKRSEEGGRYHRHPETLPSLTPILLTLPLQFARLLYG